MYWCKQHNTILRTSNHGKCGYRAEELFTDNKAIKVTFCGIHCWGASDTSICFENCSTSHRKETKGRSAELTKGADTALEWSLGTAICVAVAFKGSTFLGWRSGKKFGMMFVWCQLRGLAHCIWCPTPPAPSKLHAETKWHFANRFIKIESRELFVSDMKRQAWQQEKISRYYLYVFCFYDWS